MKGMLQALSVLFFMPLVLISAPPEYVEGEVLVLFKSTASAKARSAIDATRRPTQTRHEFAQLSKRRGKPLQLIRDKTMSTADLMALMKASGAVAAISPNYIKRIDAPVRIPNDTQFNNQWALYNTGQTVYTTTGTDDADIDFTDARRLMMDSPPETVVAIVDTGVDYNHSDLKDAMWINTGEIAGNGVDDDANGYIDDIYGYDFAGDNYTDASTELTTNDGPDSDPMDIDIAPGHGTHVAGITAATSDNARGIAGTGPLKIMALKASADGTYLTDSATLAAADYLLMMKALGVNVVAVNASYGGPASNILERMAIEDLADAGIILCTSAGNTGADNDSTATYPANYNVSNIISIAATDSSDALASFSNYGLTTVDVGAPGAVIYSSVPAHLTTDGQVLSDSQTFSSLGLTFSGLTDSNGISAILYDCGLGYPEDFPGAVAGNIALIERGVTFFTEKVSNAMDAGAVATIIYNKLGEPPAEMVPGTLGRPHDWIPSVGTTRTDGFTLLTMTGQTVTVVNIQSEASSYSYLSGTSMASPVVAGAVGVLAQHFPTDTVAERINRLYSSVDPLPSLAASCATGGRINLRNALDSDLDDLPDWWELHYAANLTVMDQTSNLDGDSLSDLNEYRTGTDPDQAGSEWMLFADHSEFSDSGVLLYWLSQPGTSYRILATDSLTNTPFQTVTNGIAATPPLNEWPVPGTNLTSRFFKIESNWE